MSKHIRIFDTTLRDGEQSPGATLDAGAKLEIAEQLARLGVDIIEAGFPAASPGDLESVSRIAAEVGTANGPIIAGLSRAVTRDIDACWQAVRHASKPRIHTFIATSKIHLQYKLKMTEGDVLRNVKEAVGYARSLCDDVEFSAEDASRTDVAFLAEVFSTAIQAGATTLNIPDTVGYAQPVEFAELVRGVMDRVEGIEACYVSVHCHDDLGLAVANSLAGMQAGARQIECTINGIGERAGNASLEELVMALHTRKEFYGCSTHIETTHLTRTSHLVSARTGILVPANKAIVGGNAFSHEAGIHQDGVIKHAETYEIMKPETVGLTQSKLVLGKHSGRHALRLHLTEMGFEPFDDDELDRIFKRFKRLADKKKDVTEAELEALVADVHYQPLDLYILQGVHVSCGAPSIPTASVSMALPEGDTQTRAATGTGPVDAIFTAINRLLPFEVKLLEYAVHAVSGGIDTLGEVTVRIRCGTGDAERTFRGHGADTDILVASAKAYVAAINKQARYECGDVDQQVAESAGA
ncbi:MAG: 2-isopropylmalate synthase [Planctomycetes bacterium]|nr:2-isopropylmalate synthase [Planctomycetota bacterium]